MLTRAIIAVALAIFIPALTPSPALAECPDTAPRTDERLDISHAFTATVTEASSVVDPSRPESADFDWHLELRVHHVYLGEIPDRMAYNGWAAGCHELFGNRLRDGDRIFIASTAFVAAPEPPGADPFAGTGARVLAWKWTGGSWRFYEEALDYGTDREFYPRAARQATTTAEILRLADLGFLPDTSTDPGERRSSGSIWVAVRGPEDWAPDPGFSLEIGGMAYPVTANNGGGVTSIDSRESMIVRLRRLPDCEPIVRFAARPGERFVIRVSAAGTPHVEDWTGRGLDSGPALAPGPLACDPLPDTATRGGAPRAGLWQATLLALSFLVGLLATRRRLSGLTSAA